MASNAIFELSQMEMSWQLFEQNGDLHDGIQSSPNTVKVNYSIAKEERNLGCLRYNVTERPSKFPGGASFYAIAESGPKQVCTVENYFDGHYYVLCPRPNPGSCAVIKIFLEWEHFRAYHNDAAGGGTISANSGGLRHGSALLLMEETHCEPLDTANSSLSTLVPAGWVMKEASAGLPGPWAEWQEKMVWRDSCGNVQRTSAARSQEYRKCFAHLDLVEFIGASHLNYMGFCAMDEVMHYLGMSKANNAHTMLPANLKPNAQSLLELNARGVHFFKGKHAENKSHFEFVRSCGDRPQDCLGAPPKVCDCFFEVRRPAEKIKSETIALRACSHKVSTLGAATVILHLLLLNLPPRVTAEKPLTEKHVMVFMSGHWDSAAQKDPKAFLKGELPHFLDVAKLIRSDPRTARIRLLLSMGPAIAGSSTGWRNNHALAAANLYIHHAVAARPELKIEMVAPSYFEFTLPRLADSADGLHFIVEGMKQKKGEAMPIRHPATDGTGDTRQCGGDVGEAYLRLLLDQICSHPLYQ